MFPLISCPTKRSLLLLFAACILFPSLTFAQRRREPNTAKVSPELTRQILDVEHAALNSDYAFRQVAHLTENIGPRLTGSPQAAKAVEYVAQELRRLGLEVKTEPVMVPHWVRGVETAS